MYSILMSKVHCCFILYLGPIVGLLLGMVGNILADLKFGITNIVQHHSPTLGAHAHAHAHPCRWILDGHGCDVIVHGWAWVGMGAILLFMVGHRFCASLHPSPNRSQTSQMQGIR